MKNEIKKFNFTPIHDPEKLVQVEGGSFPLPIWVAIKMAEWSEKVQDYIYDMLKLEL